VLRLAALAVASTSLGADGCGLQNPGLSLEAQGVAKDTIESEPALAIGAVLASIPAFALSADTPTLAEAVAAQEMLPLALPDADCLVVETDGNVVHYTFNHCTGPWGEVTVTGSETATFSAVGPGSFDIELESAGLEVNALPATHSGMVHVEVGEGEKTIAWTGQFDGTTLALRPIKNTTDLDIVLFDDASFNVNGTVATDIGLRGLEIELQDLERPGPRGTCPTGVIVVTTKVTRLTLTLTFDGSAEVFVESQSGGHGTLPLACTPAEDG
jgi:hypothetical protein